MTHGFRRETTGVCFASVIPSHVDTRSGSPRAVVSRGTAQSRAAQDGPRRLGLPQAVALLSHCFTVLAGAVGVRGNSDGDKVNNSKKKTVMIGINLRKSVVH